MALKPIRLFGDPVLRTPADPVTDFDKELRTLVKDLTTRCSRRRGPVSPPRRSASGCGSSPTTSTTSVGHLVNPILRPVRTRKQDGDEGCLSIPGLAFDCRRRAHVVAHGFDMYGEPVIIEGTELLARCIQHETDHLDGILFIDRLDPETAQGGDEGDPRGRVVRLATARDREGLPAPRPSGRR